MMFCGQVADRFADRFRIKSSSNNNDIGQIGQIGQIFGTFTLTCAPMRGTLKKRPHLSDLSAMLEYQALSLRASVRSGDRP